MRLLRRHILCGPCCPPGADDAPPGPAHRIFGPAFVMSIGRERSPTAHLAGVLSHGQAGAGVDCRDRMRQGCRIRAAQGWAQSASRRSIPGPAPRACDAVIQNTRSGLTGV